MMCISMTQAHELSMFEIGAIVSPSSDSVTIISEDNKDYPWSVGTWHYLLVNYSDGTSKIFDQNNNWIHFETEYEIDLITDEKSDKPLKLDVYWKNGGVKNVIAAEIADKNGKMVIRNGVAEYITPYNLSAAISFKMNETISKSIGGTFFFNANPKTSILKEFLRLAGLAGKLAGNVITDGNVITIKGPNGNVLKEVKMSQWRGDNCYYDRRWREDHYYYDETTKKIYILPYYYYNKDTKEISADDCFRIVQACSISNGNTEIYDILSDDAVFVKCLSSDTISRFVWTDKVCEIYYSNGDYLKYTKKGIDSYDLNQNQIFDCIIHRPDGVLTIKLEPAEGELSISWKKEVTKRPVTKYEFTSGEYKELINVDYYERIMYNKVLGVTQIINPSKSSFYRFIDPKTNHILTVTDNKGVLYDNSLKQYLTLDGKVKDFEKEAREKIEKERQSLYQKYGKQYVDALFDQGKILVGTPEGLVKSHTQSTLINETQYTRTYRIKGRLNDWAATVDVSVKTGKVTAVRNRTL